MRNIIGIHMSRLGRNELQRPKNKLNWVILLLSLIVIITLAILVVICIDKSLFNDIFKIKKDTDTAHTNAILALIGNIAGGFISGVLAVLGTLLIIRYYKNADAINKRFEQLPYLRISVDDIVTSDDTGRLGFLFNLGKKTDCIYQCTIKNIGKGFAHILVYYNGKNIGGFAYNKVIQVSEEINSFNIGIDKSSSSHSFALMFMDATMNEYVQSYEINVNYETDNGIVCNYPQLTDKDWRF